MVPSRLLALPRRFRAAPHISDARPSIPPPPLPVFRRREPGAVPFCRRCESVFQCPAPFFSTLPSASRRYSDPPRVDIPKVTGKGDAPAKDDHSPALPSASSRYSDPSRVDPKDAGEGDDDYPPTEKGRGGGSPPNPLLTIASGIHQISKDLSHIKVNEFRSLLETKIAHDRRYNRYSSFLFWLSKIVHIIGWVITVILTAGVFITWNDLRRKEALRSEEKARRSEEEARRSEAEAEARRAKEAQG